MTLDLSSPDFNIKIRGIELLDIQMGRLKKIQIKD